MARERGPLSRRCRVLLIGQPHWTAHLDRMFARHAPDLIDPTVIDISPRGLARTVPSGVDVLFRIGYRPGAATRRGTAFDLAWSVLRRRQRRAAVCHYWLGSDVLNTMTDARRGRLRAAFIATLHDIHLVTAPWHVSDLRKLGLSPEFSPMPYSLPTAEPAPLPQAFSVLTYLPARRFAFYGGELIYEVARQLPDVQFRVLGATTTPPDTPANVEYPGWVSDTAPVYADSSVVARIPEHDGIGGTVLEGLAHARHVIYTYPLPYVQQISRRADALLEAVQQLRRAHEQGSLALNSAGRQWVLDEHDEARLARDLAHRLCAVSDIGR